LPISSTREPGIRPGWPFDKAPKTEEIMTLRTLLMTSAAALAALIAVNTVADAADRCDGKKKYLIYYATHAIAEPAAKEVSVHIRRHEPLVGWITATKRTMRPAGRHNRSRTLYWMTTWLSP